MSVDIRINISFTPPNVVSATWTSGGGQPADQPDEPELLPSPQAA